MKEGCRFGEFFDDGATNLRSMNRLATFIAITALTLVLFAIAGVSIATKGADLREYLGALTTLAIIIAGLGGFNYAAGRAAGAYTQVRVAQAEQGLQPTPTAPPNPSITINAGSTDNPEIKAKDVSVQAKGNVSVTSPKKRGK